MMIFDFSASLLWMSLSSPSDTGYVSQQVFFLLFCYVFLWFPLRWSRALWDEARFTLSLQTCCSSFTQLVLSLLALRFRDKHATIMRLSQFWLLLRRTDGEKRQGSILHLALWAKNRPNLQASHSQRSIHFPNHLCESSKRFLDTSFYFDLGEQVWDSAVAGE